MPYVYTIERQIILSPQHLSKAESNISNKFRMKRWLRMFAATLCIAISPSSCSATSEFFQNNIRQHHHPTPISRSSPAISNGNGFDASVFNHATTKVIGGTPSPITLYPWFTNLYGCGGVLISPYFVLTAAHCWSLILPNDRITIGHFCDANDNCGQALERINVFKKIIHPQYTWLSDSPSNDFMLIRLNQRSTITPVPFDDGSYSPTYESGKKLWVIGIGVTNVVTGESAIKLKHAEIEYMASNQCNSRYIDRITPSMMCAGFPGRDSCQGDSGGPLYDEENDVIVGLTSWGYKCADLKYPGVYARISDQTDWIQEVICAESPSGDQPTFCKSTSTLSPVPTLSPTSCTGVKAHVTLRTDFFPYEISWEIRDIRSGEVVVGDGGFVDNYATFEKEACLHDDVCYRFKVSDTDGDGINVADAYDLAINGEDISLPAPFNQAKEYIVFGDCDDCRPTVVTLNLATDGHAGETSWAISNVISGDQIYKGGFGTPYKNYKNYTILMNLCYGCYSFGMYDTFGDGLDLPGRYTLHAGGEQIHSGGIFDHSDSFQFGNCTSTCRGDELVIKLDVVIWGDGTEMSWRIVEEETSNVVASASHDLSTNRVLCLPRKCYVFRSVNSGESDDTFGLSNFEHWLTVDGESVITQDSFGGDFRFGCGSSSNSSKAPSTSMIFIISVTLIVALALIL